MVHEISRQDSEDSVKLTRPHYPDEEDRVTECASCPRICEKCGLKNIFTFIAKKYCLITSHALYILDGDGNPMTIKQKRNIHKSMEAAVAKKLKQPVRGFFIVINDKGLHTRPATELVKCATSFQAQVNLVYHDLVVNAKSLLGILTLAATRGSRIEIEAVGEDAVEAIATLIELARNKFYIHY